MESEQVTHVVKRGVGRPTLYDESMPERIISYFDIDTDDYIKHNFTTAEKSNYRLLVNNMPSIMGFCRSVGVDKSTLYRWIDAHPEFSRAYMHARDLYEDMIVKIGIACNGSFPVFFLKCNFGWRDNEEIIQKEQAKAVRMKIVSERKDGEAKDHGESVDWGDD